MALLKTWRLTFFFMLISSFLMATQAQAQAIDMGDTFPDWQWETPQGEPVSLQEQRGKTTVVVYWATWCPFCKKLFSGLQTLSDKYRDDNVEILAINVWDKNDPNAYMRKYNYNFKVLDHGEASAKALGVYGTPTIFILDEKGEVLYRTSNSNPQNPELESAIQEGLSSLSSVNMVASNNR